MTAAQPIVYTKAAAPKYVTVLAFAQYFGVSKMFAYRLCHSGEIKWIRAGNHIRIPVSEIGRYEKACEYAARTEVWELTGEEE